MKLMQLFAVSAPGLETIVRDELKELGVGKCRVEEGGVSFRGNMQLLGRVNLHLRTASRVLVRVARFHASAFHELERNARRIAWSEFSPAGSQATLRVTCKKSKLYHSDAVAERVAKVLFDKAGVRVERNDDGAGGSTASGDDADDGADAQLFVVRLFHDQCSISADSSGAHLHMRGYREATGKAPLRETLAAALLEISGWNGTSALVDPMCGSGTIPIEAALIARSIPPGLACGVDRNARAFAFEKWREHDPVRWQEEIVRARSGIRDRSPVRILASDRDAGAVEATLANAARAGVQSDIEVRKLAISAISPPADTGLVVTNPPYGKRVGDEAQLRDLYSRFGHVIRESWDAWQITVLAGNPSLTRQLRLGLDQIGRTTNGGIPVEILARTERRKQLSVSHLSVDVSGRHPGRVHHRSRPV